MLVLAFSTFFSYISLFRFNNKIEREYDDKSAPRRYRPNWPTEGFKSLEAARDWVLSFTRWYNNEHKHSQLNFVTPHQRHTSEDKGVLAKRRLTMQQAKAQNPRRWGSQKVRNCEPVGPTTLNPVKEPEKIRLQAA